MGRVGKINAYKRVSDSDRNKIVAYRDSSLSYTNIPAPIGQDS